MEHKRRVSLAIKLNIMIIAMLLVMAYGLVALLYRVQCDNIDEIYGENAQRYVRLALDLVPPGDIALLIRTVESEEFKAVRAQAQAAGDESLMIEWLAQQVDSDSITLWDDCEVILYSLDFFRQGLDIAYTYVEYDRDGTTYYLLDPSDSLLMMGTPSEAQPEFSAYKGNTRIPPTVSKGEFGWLYTACEPVMLDGEAIAMVGVDLDMNEIMAQRHRLLRSSMVVVLLLTVAAAAASLFMIRRMAVEPIRKLAGAACGFAAGGPEEALHAMQALDDIRSDDEIGDLAREFQNMQTRIVDYTEHLTRITAERERASAELSMATRIQSSMLPNTFPPFPNEPSFDIYAMMDPAKEVGGDFYDFFMTDEHHLCLLIADVSDKGVPAALFMMAMKIMLNNQALTGGTPAEVLTAVNAQTCKNNRSKMFVTVWMGLLDVRTGVMTCASAGHEYPFLRQGEKGFALFKDPHGLVLGGLPVARYRDYTLTLKPGDALFVYTDGVPEATNPEGEFYGLERTARSLNAAADGPRKVLEKVRADIDAFVGDAKQFDDLTMLCLEYHGSRG